MFNIVRKQFQFGTHVVTLETGRIARQATGSVMVSMGDTMVLVTVVGAKKADESKDFFPLTVNYQSKFYAAGRIPGGFLRREGRPPDEETLISRLIDRPLRPLFPEGFLNEVQIVATVMSLDPEISADIPALIGASAALALSGIPFDGPVGGARVGYHAGKYLLNPSKTELQTSELDLVVAGTETAVLMVESEASGLSEEVMLGAVMFGHQQMQAAIKAIEELAKEAGKPRWDWQPIHSHPDLVGQIETLAKAKITTAYSEKDKKKRTELLGALKDEVLAHFEDEKIKKEAKALLGKIEENVVRGRILDGQPRIDGRDNKTVRPIKIDVGLLPRAHGSVLFTRGETQAIVAVTLGSGNDAQMIDEASGLTYDKFMLHYNFPPYSVGEVGRMGSTGRREIGHGRLAKRAVKAVLPPETSFPYVLRIVSDITESNGSSSMATVCGASLAMMDAGVPIKAPVSGVAMGLIKEGSKFAILTDILGDEDHLGDMDFKVAGTANGITALQMDIKIQGITEEIMKQALEQAKAGRLHILGEMNKSLSKAREDMSSFAPRIVTIKIPVDKIGTVIGPGGKMIRALTEEFGVVIEISENNDGTVNVSGVDKAKIDGAIAKIQSLTAVPEVGKIYDGVVVKIMEFGAFVNIGFQDGLVHISEISFERVQNVADFLKEGQKVRVKLLEVDAKTGKLKLSMKAVPKE